MSTLAKLAIAGLAAFAVLQAVRPGIPAKPATAEVQAPPEVKRILEKDCFNCHSDQRRLSWFDQIVPGYWLVRHDILTAREHLNFSTLGAKPAAAQRGALYEAVNMIQLGAMPLPAFLRLHPEAKVTPEELTTLKDYLAPWSTPPSQPESSSQPAMPASPARVTLRDVPPELNGLPFDPGFEGWKLLSTTDRGDNNTFRFILGNDIAVKAAQSGNISPWPDGTRFAKVAWQQELGPGGLVRPGKFIQIELMVKDAKRYKETEGWGWGRWRGLDLKPYGADAGFVKECTACHKPVRGNDYVYTLPMTNAKVAGEEAVNIRAAALPASLPYQPLGWDAITMYADRGSRTTATLYGSGAGGRSAQPGEGAGANSPVYAAGAVLALVTWAQRDDPHWFGGRIPDVPLSVEFVQVSPSGESTSYRRFAGAELQEDRVDGEAAKQRASFVMGLAPATMP
jgi:mono/diheme cytochrome c family protein